MAKYKIETKKYINYVDAASPKEAIEKFAWSMDSDMNIYFQAKPVQEYTFTKQGKKKAMQYLAELKVKRDALVKTGLDTVEVADANELTIDDLLDDAIATGFDDDGESINGFFVTDNYDSDRPYCFEYGIDIKEAEE